MLLAIGLFSFVLGLALLALSAIIMFLDIFWGFGEIIFKLSIILMLGPVAIGLLIGAFSLFLGLFGLTLLL